MVSTDLENLENLENSGNLTKTPGNHGKVREIKMYTWNFMSANERVNFSVLKYSKKVIL